MLSFSFAFPLSALLAVLAHLWPSHFAMTAYQPHFLLLVMIFWVTRHPKKCGIGYAVLMGLIADLLFGGWIGQQLLAFAVIAYLLTLLRRTLLSPTLLQEAVIIVFLVALVHLWQLGWTRLDGAVNAFAPTLIGALLSGLLWPPCALLFDKIYDSGEIR